MNKRTKAVSKPTNKTTLPKVTGRISVEVDRDSSVSIEKIENGYIVSERGTTGKGRNMKYYDKRFFSATNPIQISSQGKIKFGGKK